MVNMSNHVKLPEYQRAGYVVDMDIFIYYRYPVTSGQLFYLFKFLYEIKKPQFDQLSNVHAWRHYYISTTIFSDLPSSICTLTLTLKNEQ